MSNTKIIPSIFIGEGYVEQERNNMKNDPWVNIYAAYQNNMIGQEHVVAIEVLKAGNESIPCMVLKFGGDIKGLIPAPESGIPGTEIIPAKAADETAVKEPEKIQDEQAEKPPAPKKRGRKALKPEETSEEDKEAKTPDKDNPVNVQSTPDEPSADVERISPLTIGQVIMKMRAMVGQLVAFKVKKIDRENNLCILSRKDALEHMQSITWKEIREGDVREAVVRQVTQYLVYLNVGGIETKMPVREAGHGHILDAREVFKEGEIIEVQVLKVDPEKRKIAVSSKALKTGTDIWKTIVSRYSVNGEYLGTLTGIIDKGMFINLERDVDVFVAHPRNSQLRLKLKIGQKAIVRITGMNPDKQRLFGRLSRIIA